MLIFWPLALAGASGEWSAKVEHKNTNDRAGQDEALHSRRPT
jgi:hypothetical protein